MTKPNVVVFDIGNVLIQWDPRHLYREYFDGDEALMEQFLAEVCSPAWNRQLDRGLAWDEAVASLSRRFPECGELIRAYDERWMDMVPDVVPGAPEILAALRERGTPLHAITNFSIAKFAETRRRFPFIETFGHIVVSAEVGYLKPEPEIYHLLCERAGITPDNAFFIDDTEANCAGAQAIGMTAHHFTGAAGLRRALEKLELL